MHAIYGEVHSEVDRIAVSSGVDGIHCHTTGIALGANIVEAERAIVNLQASAQVAQFKVGIETGVGKNIHIHVDIARDDESGNRSVGSLYNIIFVLIAKSKSAVGESEIGACIGSLDKFVHIESVAVDGEIHQQRTAVIAHESRADVANAPLHVERTASGRVFAAIEQHTVGAEEQVEIGDAVAQREIGGAQRSAACNEASFERPTAEQTASGCIDTQIESLALVERCTGAV